jgi:chromosome partitioning protein
VSQIVAIAQRKGGVGKTTVAVNVAGALLSAGRAVHLIDADPQGSAVAWARSGRLAVPVRPATVAGMGLRAWIHAVWAVTSDVVIIDTPPNCEPTLGSAGGIADVILVPCGPSGLDRHALRATLQVVELGRSFRTRPGPEVVIVPVRVDRRSQEGRSIEEDLRSFGVALGPAVGARAAYVRAFTAGECVSTNAPSSEADQEMQALADHVVRRLAGVEPRSRERDPRSGSIDVRYAETPTHLAPIGR